MDNITNIQPEPQGVDGQRLTPSEALREAYGSLRAVQEILREEVDAISKRDPLERLVFDQDAAKMFAAELDNARQFMEIAFELSAQIASAKKKQQEQRDRISASGLILPISTMRH